MMEAKHISYRADIDGLRAIAILSVIIFHLNKAYLPGGYLGVDIFFVISGFLITSNIIKDIKNNVFEYRRFWQKRIARIFPTFFAVAFIVIISSYYIYPQQEFALIGSNLAAAAVSASNIYQIVKGDYFHQSADSIPLLHYWSLSVEEQFYIIFPFIIIQSIRWFKKKIIIIYIVSILLSLLLYFYIGCKNPTIAFYILPTRCWELISGSFVAFLISEKPEIKHKISKNAKYSFFALISIAASLIFIDEKLQFTVLIVFPIVASVILLVGNSIYLSKILEVKPLVFIGTISYSLYLWHWPVFSLVDYKLYKTDDIKRIFIKITITIILSILSYFLIERPARKYFNRKDKLLFSYIFIIIVISVFLFAGTRIREKYYLSARLGDLKHGGIKLTNSHFSKTVVLMGDSNASMYASDIRDICKKSHLNLIVLSVEGIDPLPMSNDKNDKIWNLCLKSISQIKPDYLIICCAWSGKLINNKEKLKYAINKIDSYVNKIIIINQPPILPDSALRNELRNGFKPPYYESTNVYYLRSSANQYINSLASDRISIIDAEKLFLTPRNEIRIFDNQGHFLYFDSDHLSSYGVSFVHPEICRSLNAVE